MSSSELSNNNSNEAIQINLVLQPFRRQTLRLAPWDCALNAATLTYITSIPGTPENATAMANLWQKGIPVPPWSYEYQYPVDCLRFCWITPQTQTGNASPPIFPAGTVTGGPPASWSGPAQKFKIAIDQFYPAISAAVQAGGTGYNVGDIITLATPSFTFTQNNQQFTMPVGAPAQLVVTGIGGGGAVTTVSVVNQVNGEATAQGGSYFSPQTNPVAQGSTTGSGSGATFNLSYLLNAQNVPAQSDQRVVLTNQEFAIGNYIRDVTDPNVMDDMFQEAWAQVVGARLSWQLLADKGKANQAIEEANRLIAEARKADGNEGLTVNDVTPDFIRDRGWAPIGANWEFSPNQSFEWGDYYSSY